MARKLQKRDWYDRGTLFLLVVATAAAIAAAYFAWCALRNTRELFVESERAWLAPMDLVNNEGNFEPNTAQEVQVLVRNTGKTPARKVKLIYRPFVVENDKLKAPGFLNEEAQKIIGYRKCRELQASETGYVVFPSGNKPEKLRVLVKSQWTEALVKREQYLVVAGCFVYESFNKSRHTYFCMFIDHRADQQSKDWVGTRCPGFTEFAD